VSNKLLWYVYPSLVPLLLAAGVSAARLIKSGKLLPVFRVAAALCTVVVLVWFVRGEIVTINGQDGNDFQLLIREMAENDVYDGCKVYVDYSIGEDGDINSVWSQQDVFVAEAYGDYECEQGGVLEVLAKNSSEDREGILFVGADVYEENKELCDSLELLGERGDYKAFAVKY
jgi:hypothetical protein